MTRRAGPAPHAYVTETKKKTLQCRKPLLDCDITAADSSAFILERQLRLFSFSEDTLLHKGYAVPSLQQR